LTAYGWDTHWRDWDRGPMDLARARAEGISLFVAKSSEGNTYLDPRFADAMTRAGPVNFPVLGAYHVLWPENPASQADDWFMKVSTVTQLWREHPCWIWQIDAELFQSFKPYRQPTVNEINACGDRIVARSGCKPSQVCVYAPEWLYGGTLSGLKYRLLWASNYVPGSGGFKQLYPGDASTRWHAYSGITPTILQYTSGATIAGQAPADASGIRVSNDADLQALFLNPSGVDPMTLDADDQAWLTTLVNSARDNINTIVRGQTPVTESNIVSARDNINTITRGQTDIINGHTDTALAALQTAVVDAVNAAAAAGGDPAQAAAAVVQAFAQKLAAP
jgi:hypothetical protein